ncbi:MAG: D-alanyl-D-alanine carboxypeptidase family protein [Fimbriimonadaceae bacterium]|nr:D-alanyl-D-alanine carboxypeptidase family protein [Fimbriimonadaceae bacterium]
MTVRWDRTKGRPEPISALNKIREVENGDPLVPILEYAPEVVIFRTTVIPYLRKVVCEMLHQASENLPEGMRLGVIDAWRPFERQVRIYDWMLACAKVAYPNRDYAQLRRTILRFVAPIDQPTPPGHCTGAAVDVVLLDNEGEQIDVWAPYDRFRAAPTYSYGLTPEATKMRMILVEAMLSAGFSNCRDEWWHYSYGDAGWAVRMAQENCFYGKADLDPELYTEQERLSQESFKTRPNPFIETSKAP